MRRAGPAREIPPPLEMLCLKVLWALGEGSVGDVRRVLAGQRPLAYTTVMTLLERLVRKGTAARRKAGRAFLYTPQVSREAMCRMALKEFVDLYFDGSEIQLRQLLDRQPLAERDSRGVETHFDAALL
jgi:predicted transcriptional regulator